MGLYRFNRHRGCVCLIRVMDGEVRKGDRIATYHGEQKYEVQEVGLLLPHTMPTDQLRCGQVGYIVCGIRTTK
jgi:translation elongation factor EF-4